MWCTVRGVAEQRTSAAELLHVRYPEDMGGEDLHLPRHPQCTRRAEGLGNRRRQGRRPNRVRRRGFQNYRLERCHPNRRRQGERRKTEVRVFVCFPDSFLCTTFRSAKNAFSLLLLLLLLFYVHRYDRNQYTPRKAILCNKYIISEIKGFFLLLMSLTRQK